MKSIFKGNAQDAEMYGIDPGLSTVKNHTSLPFYKHRRKVVVALGQRRPLSRGTGLVGGASQQGV